MNKTYSPLTQEGQVKLLRIIDVNQIISEWNTKFSIDISDQLLPNKNILLYECEKTGLRFFLPKSVSGSEELYSQLQKFPWFYMPWKWEHSVLYDRLNKQEHVLEVGCATGSFVEKLYINGFNVEGIELNSAAVNAAQEKCLPVSAVDMIQLAASRAGAFDVICSFQVLEHVPDPYNFIKECLALIKKGGRLVYCVPNNDSFLQYQFNLLDMPPHHMTQWRARVFKELEKIFPVKLSYVKYEPLAIYHIDGYLSSHKKRLIEKNKIYKLFFNMFTIKLFSLILKSGFRYFCRGQSIYVEFLKQ